MLNTRLTINTKLIRSGIALIFILFIGACSTTKSIKKDYMLSNSENKGVFLTSISYRGGYSGYSVQFRGLFSTKQKSIQFGEGMALIPIPPKGDYSHLGRKGELFAVEVPAGEYYIVGWMVFSGYASVSPAKPISIHFKVEPGKATYIGNFDFIQTDSFGLTVTGVKVNYSDQSVIDFEVLSGKYPNIKKQDIIMGIEPSSSRNGLGGDNNTSWDIPIVIM